MKHRQKPRVRAPSGKEEEADFAGKRRRKQQRELLRLLLRAAFWGAVFWVLFTQIFMLARVRGMDMFPAVKDGDLAVIFRLQQTYMAKDVVAYEAEGTLHIGRVAACANDVVSMDDTGAVSVNGTIQNTEILYPTYARGEEHDSVRVREGSIYVLGDYRIRSLDSRDFGAIPLENVKGKVITILRRRGI